MSQTTPLDSTSVTTDNDGTTRTLPTINAISATDTEAINKVVSVTTGAFDPAPLLNAFCCEQDNLEPPYPATIPWSRRLEHFSSGITAIIQDGASAVEAGDFSAIAIWQSPTYHGRQFGSTRKRNSATTLELAQKLGDAEKRLLGHNNNNNSNNNTDGNGKDEEVKLRPAYLLQFLARNRDGPSVSGAVSAVILPFLARARNEGVPAWLEAISPRTVEIYQHYGFRVVERVTVGVGRFDAEGWPREGGEGVSIWVMVYDGHLGG